MKKQITYKNVNWVNYQGMLIPDIPPHQLVEFKRDECKSLLKNSRAHLVRWISEWDKTEKSEFWYIIKDEYKGLEEFSSNTRSKIRRGLKRNEAFRIDKQELKNSGFNVYLSAFKRYKTFIKPMSQKEFCDRIDKMDPDEYDFWGVYNKEQLVAYAEVRKMKEMCHLNIIKFHPDYMKQYPGYALFYSLIDHYLSLEHIGYISNGTKSLSHDTNIQEFLLQKFNFRKAYCRLNICYSPIVKLVVVLLYPFRKVLNKIPFNIAQKLYALLNQEYIKQNS